MLVDGLSVGIVANTDLAIVIGILVVASVG